MNVEQTQEEILRQAETMNRFLADPIIAGAIARLERKFYEDFKAAKNSDERVTTWAKANLWDDFVKELRSVSDAGKIVKAMNDRSQR